MDINCILWNKLQTNDQKQQVANRDQIMQLTKKKEKQMTASELGATPKSSSTPKVELCHCLRAE